MSSSLRLNQRLSTNNITKISSQKDSAEADLFLGERASLITVQKHTFLTLFPDLVKLDHMK